MPLPGRLSHPLEPGAAVNETQQGKRLGARPSGRVASGVPRVMFAPLGPQPRARVAPGIWPARILSCRCLHWPVSFRFCSLSVMTSCVTRLPAALDARPVLLLQSENSIASPRPLPACGRLRLMAKWRLFVDAPRASSAQLPRHSRPPSRGAARQVVGLRAVAGIGAYVPPGSVPTAGSPAGRGLRGVLMRVSARRDGMRRIRAPRRSSPGQIRRPSDGGRGRARRSAAARRCHDLRRGITIAACESLQPPIGRYGRSPAGPCG